MKYALILVTFLIFGIIIIIFLFPKKNTPAGKQTLSATSSNFSIEKAPSESLKGQISSLSGEVAWESRTASSASKIINPQEIQQGEKIVTKKGSAIVEFSKYAYLNIYQNSEVNIIQTLITNIVFEETVGEVSYKKTGSSDLSIRAMHLLTEVKEGEIILLVDKDKSQILIDGSKGSGTVAFNDIQNVSTVVNLIEGRKYIYDDSLRQITRK